MKLNFQFSWKTILIIIIIIIILILIVRKVRASRVESPAPPPSNVTSSSAGSGFKPVPTSAASFPLKAGSKNTSVLNAQIYINYVARIPAGLQPIKEDGVFGPETAAAADQAAQLGGIKGHVKGQISYSEMMMLENLYNQRKTF